VEDAHVFVGDNSFAARRPRSSSSLVFQPLSEPTIRSSGAKPVPLIRI
jgi:hypothetical protein